LLPVAEQPQTHASRASAIGGLSPHQFRWRLRSQERLGLALQALNWIHQAKIAMKRTILNQSHLKLGFLLDAIVQNGPDGMAIKIE
jgi:hypothetical protein